MRKISIATVALLLGLTSVEAQQRRLVSGDVDVLPCAADVKSFTDEMQIKPAELPVGTILMSILDVKHFPCTVSGSWILASGKTLRTGQKLERLFRSNLDVYAAMVDVPGNRMHAPNLQGVFPRGMDYSNDKERGNPEPTKLGEYQADSIKAHTHKVSKTYPNKPNAPDQDADRRTLASKGWDNHYPDAVTEPQADGNVETRPRSVSVNYYIRVD